MEPDGCRQMTQPCRCRKMEIIGENNRDFGWNYMPGLEGNAFCPGSMPGVLEKDYPLAMAYVPWQQWKNPYGPERGLAQGTIFSELDLAFDKGRCS